MNAQLKPAPSKGATLQSLCKAIRAIPGRGHVPFAKFLFHTLRACMEAEAMLGKQAAFLNLPLWVEQGAEVAPPTESEAVLNATRAYMTLVLESPPFTDVLCGAHAHLLARGDGDGLGQYFIPWDFADLTATLVRNHLVHHPLKREPGAPFTIQEPACGAGGLILGLLRDLPPHVSSREVLIEAIDLDPLCCAMTTLQLVANSLLHGKLFHRVRIWCGNTLLPPEELRLFAGLKRETDHQDRLGWMDEIKQRWGLVADGLLGVYCT